MLNKPQFNLFGQIQTSPTGGQLYSDTYPMECSNDSSPAGRLLRAEGVAVVLRESDCSVDEDDAKVVYDIVKKLKWLFVS